MKHVERKYKRCGEKKTYVLQMTLVNLEMHIYSIKTVLDIMSLNLTKLQDINNSYKSNHR